MIIENLQKRIAEMSVAVFAAGVESRKTAPCIRQIKSTGIQLAESLVNPMYIPVIVLASELL
jgi:hypothetical protein